jgi:hypothetical protein
VAPSIAAAQQAGDQFQIARSVEIDQRGPDAVSNSQNSDALVEKIVSVTPEGMELEYSLPPGTQGDWTFPVRVFKPKAGPLQLRDRADLEARIDQWLKRVELTRAACGHWIMGWTAMRISCEPEAALGAVEPFTIGQLDLAEGALYTDAQALRSAPLKAKPDGKGLTTELAIDPAAIREELAQTDIHVAEISGEKLGLEAARKAHAADQISGTIKVTIDTAGAVTRRTRVATQTITRAGVTETRTVTEIVERRPVGAPAPSPDSI